MATDAAARRREPGRHRLRHQLRRAAARAPGSTPPRCATRCRALVDALYARDPDRRRAARSTVSLLGARARPRCWRRARRGPSAGATATHADLERIESGGRLAGAEPDAVSARARERGLRQLGSLGSGNHFLELQVVDEIYDGAAAARCGLRGALAVMIHTGSRGLGHQVCTDYLAADRRGARRYGISVPDRQLACAPVEPREARLPRRDAAAANFAFANRQVLAHAAGEDVRARARRRPRDLGPGVVYDVAHNIAKEEEHEIDGAPPARAASTARGRPARFPASRSSCRATWAAIILHMARCWGRTRRMRETFGSTCHGAGRRMSRTAAVKAAPRSAHRRGARGPRRGGARDRARVAGRGDARGLQGRARSGGRRPPLRDLDAASRACGPIGVIKG